MEAAVSPNLPEKQFPKNYELNKYIQIKASMIGIYIILPHARI
jgi:hypothetical protein